MNLNLKGKIGRLPAALREEVNVRLRNGETGRTLADWLNGLPEIQAWLAAEFNGKAVREQNISMWRRGGHQQWLRMQEAQAMMERIGPEVAAWKGAAQEPMTETLATWVTARYIVAVKKMEGQPADPATAWKRMREYAGDVVALRRGELQAKRMTLKREKAQMKMKIQKNNI